MFGLCVQERYHCEGMCRVYWFTSEQARDTYRAKEVNASATTWNHGDPMPRRKVLEFFLNEAV